MVTVGPQHPNIHTISRYPFIRHVLAMASHSTSYPQPRLDHRPTAEFYKLIFCTIQVRSPSSKYLQGLEIIMPGECFVRICWVMGRFNFSEFFTEFDKY